MTPNLSEDEIDDLIYFARAGEVSDLNETLAALAAREAVPAADILLAARDSGKSTCLHMATGNGNLEITTLLLSHFTATSLEQKKKAFLDAPNEFGNTGLHWAALGGHLGVVKFLVDQGASVGAANDKGYIPLDVASFGEKMEVVDYFLAGMGDLEGENGDGLGTSAESLELDEAVAPEEEAQGKTEDKAEGGAAAEEAKGKSSSLA